MSSPVSPETTLDLVDEHGTPLYITDLDAVQERFLQLEESLPSCTVKYASKANFDPQVLETLIDVGAGFVCGSSHEALVAYKAGAHASQLQVTAVSPKDESIEQLVALSNESDLFTTTVNDLQSLERLIDAGYKGRVLLRLTPSEELRAESKYKDGSLLKFGMTDEEIGFAIGITNRSDATLAGFHCHLGGSFLMDSVDKYAKHIEYTVEKATDHQDLDDIDVLNFGGGFGIPYEPSEPELDLEIVSEKIQSSLPENASNTEFVVEPGRYIVGPTTVLVSEVKLVREKNGQKFVGVDAGMAEFSRTTMFDVYHHISPVRSWEETQPIPQTVAGPTCSGADIFAHQREFPAVGKGDLIQIENVGAYGLVMANHFHAYPSPTVVSTDGQESPPLEEIVNVGNVL